MDVYGLVGNPVGHSLSPPMHEAGFEALGIDARYVTFEPEDAGAAIEAAADLGIAGLNVTIPFKRDVLEHVEPDATARRVGAVNTVDFAGVGRSGEDDPGGDDDRRSSDGDGRSGADHDRPTGHNTDVAGVRRSFAHHDVDLDGKTVVQIGAGGAGRAIAFALADAGATVHVANRTASRAHDLAEEIPGATGHGLDEVPGLIADADALANATSVGMDEDASPVAADALHADLVVFDAVYSPLDTRLLRDAADAGAATIDGGWMLLYQGVAAFERWTGRDAPIEAMNAALRDHLE